MKEIFPIISPGNGALWLILPIGAILLAVLVFLAFIAFYLRHGAVEVSAEGMQLRVPLYGRHISISSLVLDAAREVSLPHEQNLQPKWRTNGIGLPGYSVGWFTLLNGGRALAAITDSRRVAYIPTREGYSILVSVAEPQILLDTLKRFAMDSRK